LSRRTFLRGAGVALALPLLDSMRPAFAAGKADVPRRMVCIETIMGILPQFFFPEKAGKDYPLSPYLERLKAFRNQLTRPRGETSTRSSASGSSSGRRSIRAERCPTAGRSRASPSSATCLPPTRTRY
jgi:hypothetical protein